MSKHTFSYTTLSIQASATLIFIPYGGTWVPGELAPFNFQLMMGHGSTKYVDPYLYLQLICIRSTLFLSSRPHPTVISKVIIISALSTWNPSIKVT